MTRRNDPTLETLLKLSPMAAGIKRARPAKTPDLHALEPRYLFDAAAATTLGDALSEQVAQTQTDNAIAAMSDPNATQVNAGEDTDLFVSAPAVESKREVIFIDPNVADLDGLLADLSPSAEVHLLDAHRDGVQQIAEILANESDIDAIHIISHGAGGRLTLGNVSLTQDSIAGEHAQLLETIGNALSEDADLLIYGCNFAEGSEGEAASQALAHATGADVAASTDTTGGADAADRDLEFASGSIETISLRATNWTGSLAGITIYSNNFDTDALSHGDSELTSNFFSVRDIQVEEDGGSEGTGTIADKALDLTGDALAGGLSGIDTTAASASFVGASNTLFSAVGDTATVLVSVDTDGDLIGDSVDIDDDNDGILDTFEADRLSLSPGSTFDSSLEEWQSTGVELTAGETYELGAL